MTSVQAPTVEDLAVQEARKLVLRALDAKICVQDDLTALKTVELASKLAGNILDHPGEEKYHRFKASNPNISKNLMKVVGGQDLLIAMGFRTQVHEFEEYWVHTPSDEARRILEEARECLGTYQHLVSTRKAVAEKARADRMAGEDAERKRTLLHIAGDKEDRRDKVWVRQQQQPPQQQQPEPQPQLE